MTTTLIATPDEPAKAPAPFRPVVSKCDCCGSQIGRMLASEVRCPRRPRK